MVSRITETCAAGEDMMSKQLAERLLAGESLPAEQMLEASESFVDLCIEQKQTIKQQAKRIAELEKLNDAYSATVRILVADLRGNR